MVIKPNEVAVPSEVWDGLEYTSINAAVLFADLENSVMLSSTLHPHQYQELLNACQHTMMLVVEELIELGMHVAEHRISGDELVIFFYNPNEVYHNYRLDGPDPAQDPERKELVTKCAQTNEGLAFDALKAAIILKNRWLTQDVNMVRGRSRQEPLGLGIGVHNGRVHLCNRPDGKCRIEGYTVNFAKRIESFSRAGRYSRIMLSQDTHDIIRGSVRGHTMLRQRVFFQTHDVEQELLKGITRSKKIFELKFFSRIGIRMSPDALEQYEALFALDQTNIWAYYQLFEHFAYVEQDWETGLEHAKRAYHVQPNDEKVLLDLSRCFMQQGGLVQAKENALRALELNPSFDLVYEHLALLSQVSGDEEATMLEYCSKAINLAPGSPVNHLNFGLALCENGQLKEGGYHLHEAFRLYPDYLKQKEVLKEMGSLNQESKLPDTVENLLHESGVDLKADTDA